MRPEQNIVIPDAVLNRLSAQLPVVSERVMAAVVERVPEYDGALAGEMAATIEGAVHLALRGFLRLAARGGDPGTPMQASVDAAYALGQGEARGGRSMDALLAAYRIGARIAWRDLSAEAVEAGLDASTLARFAELVFAYIDSLSAASVSGHAEELAAEGRVREQRRERLASALLAGRDQDALIGLAERAGWTPPTTLAAVVLPAERVSVVATRLGATTLRAPDEGGQENPNAVLLVPDAEGPGRRRLLRALENRRACIGPSRRWSDVAASYARARRSYELGLAQDGPLDTDEHLARLVVLADGDAHADLRERALAPLMTASAATADRLAQTLRSWLLHQGRRDAVAADLHVHAQTVRYRMGQVRAAYGDRLNDPDMIRDLMVALAVDPELHP
ncbi:PucR family transcriptional regulator [Calidifontibacter terrae]